VNKSLDYLKKRKMEIASIDGKDIPQEDHEVDKQEEIHSKAELIKKEIDKLPDNYRIVTVMFLLEGYTHNEISEILEITPESSRVRFKRAKEMLLKSNVLRNSLQEIIMN